jgi:DNA repair protein RadC
LFKVLNRAEYSNVLARLKALDWNDLCVFSWLRDAFLQVKSQKFSNIELIASLLGVLKRSHQKFVVHVVDGLIDSIISELEKLTTVELQQTLSSVRYLGELYNSKVVKVRNILYFFSLF